MTVYFFIGTTAELIRIAPIVKELNSRKIMSRIITSGQVSVRFDQLSGYTENLSPYISLEEKPKKSSPPHFLWWATKTLVRGFFLFRSEFSKGDLKDSLVVICGDPVSTTIGGIISKLLGLRLVHIESGDLSFNYAEPFPEEICRRINLALADILFPPSSWAMDNLSYLNKPKINTHYNTQLETFIWALKLDRATPIADKLAKNRYYVLIMHRQEHVYFRKNWTKRTLKQVIELSDPGLTCVLFNYPITVKLVEKLGFGSLIESGKIKITPPVPYHEFLKILKNSEFIATDGATNQYEAYLLGKPCLLLRDFTEQIEGLGNNIVLFKSNASKMEDFLNNYKNFIRHPVNPKIKPSKIVVKSLVKLI